MRMRRAATPPGSVWRQVVLGAEAVYEVLCVEDDHVEVSVRSAPGMRPGTRVRLTKTAIRAMERVEDDESPPPILRSV